MTTRYQGEGVDRVWYTVGASKGCRPNQHRKSSHMAKLAGTTYQELDRILVKNHTKTIGNNTTAHRGDDDVIYVYLHGHNIVDLHKDGAVALRDCGYQTVTTKERLNQFCPMPYRVSQVDYEWFIFDVEMMEKMEWVTGRGVMILPDGVLVYAAADGGR